MKVTSVWTCDYCGKEHKTKKLADTHELTCEKKSRDIIIKIHAPNRDAIISTVVGFFTIYFLIYVAVNSYAKENGLPAREFIQPHKWFLAAPTPTIFIPTPTDVPTPIPSLKPKAKAVVNANSAGTDGNEIECIGPDSKHFNTTMDECKSLNEKWGKPANYMTSCTFPSECGGGVRRIPKSECDVPCKRTDGNNSGNSGGGTTQCSKKVSYTTTQGIVDRTYYCCEDKVNELARLENLIELKQGTSDACTSSAELTAKNCSTQTCSLSLSNDEMSNCIKSCYDSAFAKCTQVSTNVGNSRKDLMNKVFQYCP